MAGTKKSYVDIKELYYGAVFATVADPAVGLTGAEVFAHTWKPVTNIHGTSWKYNQDAPNVTQHVNQLTGNPYRADVKSGAKTMDFNIGEYDYAMKAEFQGGTATDKSWKAPAKPAIIYMAFKAVTDDDCVIVFTRALVLSNSSNTDNAIGLNTKGVAMDSGVAGLEDEAWFDLSEIKVAL